MQEPIDCGRSNEGLHSRHIDEEEQAPIVRCPSNEPANPKYRITTHAPYALRVSGDSVVWVGRLVSRASNYRCLLLLIDVPRTKSFVGAVAIDRFLHRYQARWKRHVTSAPFYRDLRAGARKTTQPAGAFYLGAFVRRGGPRCRLSVSRMQCIWWHDMVGEPLKHCLCPFLERMTLAPRTAPTPCSVGTHVGL